MLKKHGFAGVIFFGANMADTEQAVRLVDAMQTANATVAGRPQLLTAIDQEGGPVVRLGHGCQMTGNMALGTISTLKHFPGHGDTATDSHTGLPRIEKSLEELKSFELIPFQACIDAGAEAVMTAHIQYPLIEEGTAVSVETGEEINLPAVPTQILGDGVFPGKLPVKLPNVVADGQLTE